MINMPLSVNIGGQWKQVSEVFANIGGSWKSGESVFCNISSVWKEVWSKIKQLSYYGTATSLQYAVRDAGSACTDALAIFVGGYFQLPVTYRSQVNAYNQELTRSNATLSTGRSRVAGQSIGGLAIFAGGLAADTHSNVVDAYDVNLSRSTSTIIANRYQMGYGRVGNYAVFSGGRRVNSTNYDLAYVDAFDANLSRVSPPDSHSSFDQAGAFIDEYVIFAGGTYYSSGGKERNLVSAYDSSLVKLVVSSLSQTRTGAGGASVSNHVLIAGGYSSYGYRSSVEIYDSSLVSAGSIDLSFAGNCKGESFQGCAVFVGTDYIDVFDNNLVMIDSKPINKTEAGAISSFIGSYLLITGGLTGDTYSKVVQVYELK